MEACKFDLECKKWKQWISTDVTSTLCEDLKPHGKDASLKWSGSRDLLHLGKLELLTNWYYDQVLPNFDCGVIGQMTELGRARSCKLHLSHPCSARLLVLDQNTGRNTEYYSSYSGVLFKKIRTFCFVIV